MISEKTQIDYLASLAKRTKMIEDEAPIITEVKRVTNAGHGQEEHINLALEAQKTIV